METGLRLSDLSELRARLLVYLADERLTYAAAARRCGLKPHQVRDFLSARQCASQDVAAALCRLPLDLVYQGPRLLPRL